jgi:AcrR family transcriptional regulator
VRQAILDAAKRVFVRWGLNKTTMEDIAREAGKGKSTLYYYFKSKEEVFETVAMEELQNISAVGRKAMEAIESPKSKLKAYMIATITEIKKTASVYSVIKGEMKGNKVFIENIRRQFDKIEESLILDILKEGLKLKELNFIKKTELEKAANVVVGIIRGLELYLFLENDDSEKIDIAARLLAEGL